MDSERRLSFMLESVAGQSLVDRCAAQHHLFQGAGLHLIGASAAEQVGMTLYEVLKTRDPGFYTAGRAPARANRRARSLRDQLARTLLRDAGRAAARRRRTNIRTVGIAIDVTDRKEPLRRAADAKTSTSPLCSRMRPRRSPSSTNTTTSSGPIVSSRPCSATLRTNPSAATSTTSSCHRNWSWKARS